VLTRVR